MLTTVAAGRVYDYSNNVGRFSQGGGLGFQVPTDLAVGDDDRLYVLSRGSDNGVGANPGLRVTMLTIGDEEFLGDFLNSGFTDGGKTLVWPSGIAIDSERNVYVCDEWVNVVSCFDSDGGFLSQWSTLEDNDCGPHGAASLAIDGEDNVYISDGRSHQIRKFTKDGRLLNSWGSYGSDIGQFDSPWGITCDGQGYVYVADFKNHRIQKFSSAGEWVTQFGSSGSEAATLFRPTDVAVDPDGDVYVTDWGSNGVNPGRVQIYDSEGNFIANLMGDCVDLSKWAQIQVDSNPDTKKARRTVPSLEPQWRFALPTGIVFDELNSRFLVSERPRHRVQIYNKLKDYQEAPINL